jgi:hypothetical protein
MKIRPVGTEFFHADEWMDKHTDMKALIVAFRNFSNTPKDESLFYNVHCALSENLFFDTA